uniref:PH domain-containing protein n=1 Tax=Romanomermis culicivorax TaxID=13658 RepID=A0A915IDK8_ROMCU
MADFEHRDEREFVFGVDTSSGDNRYFSVEAQASLDQLRAAWHRSIYYTVSRLQSKTFACNVKDRPSGLVFDIKHGIGLYDIHKKKYAWRYKFSMLKSSCDDGKMHIRLAFDNRSTPPELKIVDLDCTELYPLIYTLHSFMLARVISVDQNFVDKNKF